MTMSTAAYAKKVQVSANGNDNWLDVPATSPSLELSSEVLDNTDLATNAGYRTRILGLHDWSISCDSNFTSGNAALTLIRNALTTRSVLHARYLPKGAADNAAIALGFKGPVVVENFNLTGEVGGLETVAITLQANGALAAAG